MRNKKKSKLRLILKNTFSINVIKSTNRGQGHLVESCPSFPLKWSKTVTNQHIGFIYTQLFSKSSWNAKMFLTTSHFSRTDLCLAVAWCCLHTCRWLWCSGRWWCWCWGWGWPWSPSSSSRLSQEAGAALCGPRRAAAPGRPPAPHDPSVCCRTPHRHFHTFYISVRFPALYLGTVVVNSQNRHKKSSHISEIK